MKKKGFTLVELLAVIAILAILVLIALPQVIEMFRKSRDDTFLVEARAIMNAAEKKLSEEVFAGDLEEKIYCYASGENENKLDTSGEEIFYLIGINNGKIKSYAISDNVDHTVFKVSEDGSSLTSADIEELYENIIDISDCDIDYLLATGGVPTDPNVPIVQYDDDGNPIHVPYAGFTGYSCKQSNITETAENLFDFNINDKSITGYHGDATSIVIPCSIRGYRVEKIAANAFRSKGLTKVTMPDTIKSIGDYAFANNQLTTVNLGNSITSIGCGAFANNKLMHVLFPRGIETLGTNNCPYQTYLDKTYIGGGVFQNNTTLGSVLFQSNALTSIGSYTFSNTNLASIDFSKQTKLTTIGRNAFYNINGATLNSIKFPNNITTIGDKAFYNCGLRGIYLSSNKGVSIGEEAFAHNKITSITLKGVTHLGPSAFRDNMMEPSKAYVMNVDSSGRETGVLNSYAGASRNDLSIPAKVKDISECSFRNMGLTGTLNTGDSVTVIPGKGYMCVDGSCYYDGAFANNNLTKVIIGKGVKKIDQYAFYQNNKLSEIQFSEGLEEIGTYAFAYNKLNSLTLPDSLKTIGNYAFYYNYNSGYSSFQGLNLSMGKNIETIGSSAFYYNKLNTVDLSRCTKLTRIGSSTFSNNSINELKLPSSLKYIDSYAFQSNKLKKISLDGDNVQIGAYAFSSNTIQEVEIGGSNNTFSNNVFASNIISKLHIDGTNIKIGSEVFANNNISDFEMKGVTQLGTNAFKNNKMPQETAYIMQPDSNGNPTKVLNSYGGEKRDNLVIPNTVNVNGTSVNLEEIPSNAFLNIGLTGSLTMGTNVKKVGTNAFAKNSITSVDLKSVNNVGSFAFAFNQIVDPNLSGITTMGDNAFKANKFSDANAFVIKPGSDGVLNSYAGAKLENITIPNNIKSINYENFNYSNYLNNVYAYMKLTGTFTFGSGLTSIPSSSLSSQYVNKIVIGDNITTIPSSAFSSLSSLNEVTIGSKVETIDTQAFYSCSNLKTINWNNKVKTIKWGAFSSTGLEEVTIPDSVEFIGGVQKNYNYPHYYYTYYKEGREGYENLNYTSNWTYTGAFGNNSKLTKVTFGSGLKTMEPAAFQGCTKLATADTTKIHSLSTIPDFAFYGDKLTRIVIPDSVDNIGDHAFNNNSTLNEIYVEGKAQIEQFNSLGDKWNGTCNNIRFAIASCFQHDGAKITGYTRTCSRKVEIPEKLDGTTITTIAANAFNGLNLSSIYIPKTVKIIEDGALNGATSNYIMVANKANSSEFQSAPTNWNNNIHVIYQNDQTTCLKVNSSNTMLGYYSDAKVCDKKVHITKNVTSIVSNALSDAVYVSIDVEDGTRISSFGDNWHGTIPTVDFKGDSFDYNCFTLSGSTITDYKNFCATGIDLTRNGGKIQNVLITKIGNRAFYDKGIKTLKISDEITEIGDYAFTGNYELSSISFENKTSVDSSKLNKIGAHAFNRTDMIQINLPKSLKYVGDYAFDEITKLRKILILNKTDLSEFTYLGEGWSGDCEDITFQQTLGE